MNGTLPDAATDPVVTADPGSASQANSPRLPASEVAGAGTCLARGGIGSTPSTAPE